MRAGDLAHKGGKLLSKREQRAQAPAPRCVVCQVATPHLFKGERYCADHHPDPGPHIARSRVP
jgi:hypothetical protein